MWRNIYQRIDERSGCELNSHSRHGFLNCWNINGFLDAKHGLYSTSANLMCRVKSCEISTAIHFAPYFFLHYKSLKQLICIDVCVCKMQVVVNYMFCLVAFVSYVTQAWEQLVEDLSLKAWNARHVGTCHLDDWSILSLIAVLSVRGTKNGGYCVQKHFRSGAWKWSKRSFVV